MKTKILGIAPFEELNRSMKLVSQNYKNIECDIYTGDLKEGREIVKNNRNKDYDIIISRGGTAKLIREISNVPVIDIEISIYDVLGIIKLAESYSDKIAIVAFSNITKTAYLICDLLNYNLKIVTITSSADAEITLEQLKKEKYDLILCDSITNEIAMGKSINTLLITSGLSSIERAFEEAIRLSSFIKKNTLKRILLEKQLDNYSSKSLILDQNLNILISNISKDLEKRIQFLIKNNTKKMIGNIKLDFGKNSYILDIKKEEIDEDFYYLIKIKENLRPMINTIPGLSIKRKKEVRDDYSKKLTYSKLVEARVIDLLSDSGSYYNSLIISGENGTGKMNVAIESFLNQDVNSNNLYVVNCNLINNSLWEYLINVNDGPFLLEGNTILFDNVENFKMSDLEKLINITESTRFLNNNNIIFTYNSDNQNDKLVNILKYKLGCKSIYLKSLRFRKGELNYIITILINKLNIENNLNIIGFEPEALQNIINYSWPGNINQLEHSLKELMVNTKGHYINNSKVEQLLSNLKVIDNFNENKNKLNLNVNYTENLTLKEYNKSIIEYKLKENDGNKTKTAKILGISRTTLWRMLNN